MFYHIIWMIVAYVLNKFSMTTIVDAFDSFSLSVQLIDINLTVYTLILKCFHYNKFFFSTSLCKHFKKKFCYCCCCLNFILDLFVQNESKAADIVTVFKLFEIHSVVVQVISRKFTGLLLKKLKWKVILFCMVCAQSKIVYNKCGMEKKKKRRRKKSF